MRLPSEKARIKKEEQSEATSNETYRIGEEKEAGQGSAGECA